MTEYELDMICQRNPDCGGRCISCPVMAKYQRTQLGYDDDDEEEDD